MSWLTALAFVAAQGVVAGVVFVITRSHYLGTIHSLDSEIDNLLTNGRKPPVDPPVIYKNLPDAE